MSDLPELDLHRVNNKLVAKVAELQNQVVQLETIAEQIRDERDSANEKNKILEKQISDFNTANKPPVAQKTVKN